MSKTKDSHELKTISDAIAYWRSCIASWEEVPDQDIAAWIVGVMSNDHFEDWKGSEGDPQTDFSKLWELAADLEIDTYYLPDSLERDQAWGQVRELLERLEAKYGN